MTTQPKGQGIRCRVVGLFALVALFVAGCQTSPGQLGGCTPRTANQGHLRVLAHQVVGDTAEEIAHHPLRSGRTVLSDQVGWFASAGRGIFGKRIGMHLRGAPGPVCPDGLDPALLETNLQPAAVQLYREGGDALAALERAIDSATCRIDVLIYIWADDPVGWDIAQHLAARAAPNLPVRIMIDGGANMIFTPKPDTESTSGESAPKGRQSPSETAGELNRVVCWLARQPCVQVIRDRNAFAHFDHRKLVLIDGQNAWTGGRNFTFPGFFKRHDLSFTIQGPLVSQWQQDFENYWREQGGPPTNVQSESPPLVVANAAGRIVANSPTHHGLRRALYHALDHARSSVWMENPYFTDNGIITKLAAARRRGVDARMVFTIQSDTESINHTNRVTANRLLAAGVRVYLYPGRVHTKAALVDGCWAYLGSGNFDLLSLRRNHEMGVIFGPGPLLNDLEQVLFLPDFRPEWELCAPLKLTAQDYAYEMMAAFFL